MADITSNSWDQVDADNDSASPNGAPEGMSPGGVNDTMRMMMGALKRAYAWSENPTVTTGTSTAFLLTYDVAPAALVDGMTHVVHFHTTCGASPTLNINSLGAHALHYFDGSDWVVVPDGTIIEDMVCTMSYNANSGAYRIRTFPSSVATALLGADNVFTGTNTFNEAINGAARVTVASATTCDIGAALSNYLVITGTTTITSFGTIASSAWRDVVFSGAMLLTYNATSLILPTSANITTVSGDTATFLSEGSGNWRCVAYQRRSGYALLETAYTPPQRAYAYVTVAAGSATMARSSGFTSVTRTAAGKFTCVLSSAMADANYRVLAMTNYTIGSAQGEWIGGDTAAGTKTTTTFYLKSRGGGGDADPDAINIEVFV